MLAEVAFHFGSYEFFWLALFGIVISGSLTSPGDPLKGYIAGVLGLLVAMNRRRPAARLLPLHLSTSIRWPAGSA